MVREKLLVHEALVSRKKGVTADRVTKYGEPVKLSKIRVGMSRGVTANGTVSDDSLKLFYFCGQSLPLGFEFDCDMKITFEGREYFPQKIDSYYTASDRPHHYVVTLK